MIEIAPQTYHLVMFLALLTGFLLGCSIGMKIGGRK